MSLKSIVWGLFGKFENKRDSNKVNGRGFLQRYNEMIMEEFDEETLPYLTNIVEYTTNPSSMLERFIPFWENAYGTPILDTDIDIRRKMLRYSVRFNSVKGTIRGYQMLFQQVGISCSITEYHEYTTFDAGLKFDNPDRTFDKIPSKTFQTPYKLFLSGPEYTTTQLDNIVASVVSANEPADAVCIGYLYTREDIPQLFSNDFFSSTFFN